MFAKTLHCLWPVFCIDCGGIVGRFGGLRVPQLPEFTDRLECDVGWNCYSADPHLVSQKECQELEVVLGSKADRGTRIVHRWGVRGLVLGSYHQVDE